MTSPRINISALSKLRDQLPAAAEGLNLDLGSGMVAWQEALDRKLLPRMSGDFPLVAAICGGGSAGKSTLFNSLVGTPISPTGGRAGLNRRVLVALHPQHLKSKGLMNSLGHAFKETWQPFGSTDELTTPGHPLYWSDSQAPRQVVLLDTPDIDTGAAGHYTNREAAQQSLEAADLLIYIFTNATYNNRDNTDFMAALLNTVGTRPCILVYRVYPSFGDNEVNEHAHTVARNLYGTDAGSHVLGVFRADEDNAVAAGETTIRVCSVDSSQRELAVVLSDLDTTTMRNNLLASVFHESLNQAEGMIHRLRQANTALQTYGDLLLETQQRCVQRALSHFPTDRVLGRFAEIWLAGDPAHIKWMRRTGRIVEWPYKMLYRVFGRKASTDKPFKAISATDQLDDLLEVDLLDAANQLYRTVLDSNVQFRGRSAAAHPALEVAREALRQKDWQTILEGIAAQKKTLLSWSRQLEAELEALADELRGRMGLFDQVRQTFAALLNVIPATAAVTYILHTGDPVGATGIKVKLTGLFGLQDLYALIAIPATSGMRQADRKQLEHLLTPVAGAWLANKLQVVEALFREHISGEILDLAAAAFQNTDAQITQAEQALAACQKEP
jgi:hypothetical protein